MHLGVLFAQASPSNFTTTHPNMASQPCHAPSLSLSVYASIICRTSSLVRPPHRRKLRPPDPSSMGRRPTRKQTLIKFPGPQLPRPPSSTRHNSRLWHVAKPVSTCVATAGCDRRRAGPMPSKSMMHYGVHRYRDGADGWKREERSHFLKDFPLRISLQAQASRPSFRRKSPATLQQITTRAGAILASQNQQHRCCTHCLFPRLF
ncbi:hypothetical protein LY78DRAFT_178612 [Colletotrichum sublineola]|nr:hypothetical protein LY78DRAFT_178612 [Colletotrichum sublineola]